MKLERDKNLSNHPKRPSFKKRLLIGGLTAAVGFGVVDNLRAQEKKPFFRDKNGTMHVTTSLDLLTAAQDTLGISINIEDEQSLKNGFEKLWRFLKEIKRKEGESDRYWKWTSLWGALRSELQRRYPGWIEQLPQQMTKKDRREKAVSDSLRAEKEKKAIADSLNLQFNEEPEQPNGTYVVEDEEHPGTTFEKSFGALQNEYQQKSHHLLNPVIKLVLETEYNRLKLKTEPPTDSKMYLLWFLVKNGTNKDSLATIKWNSTNRNALDETLELLEAYQTQGTSNNDTLNVYHATKDKKILTRLLDQNPQLKSGGWAPLSSDDDNLYMFRFVKPESALSDKDPFIIIVDVEGKRYTIKLGQERKKRTQQTQQTNTWGGDKPKQTKTAAVNYNTPATETAPKDSSIKISKPDTTTRSFLSTNKIDIYPDKITFANHENTWRYLLTDAYKRELTTWYGESVGEVAHVSAEIDSNNTDRPLLVTLKTADGKTVRFEVGGDGELSIIEPPENEKFVRYAPGALDAVKRNRVTILKDHLTARDIKGNEKTYKFNFPNNTNYVEAQYAPAPNYLVTIHAKNKVGNIIATHTFNLNTKEFK